MCQGRAGPGGGLGGLLCGAVNLFRGLGLGEAVDALPAGVEADAAQQFGELGCGEMDPVAQAAQSDAAVQVLLAYRFQPGPVGAGDGRGDGGRACGRAAPAGGAPGRRRTLAARRGLSRGAALRSGTGVTRLPGAGAVRGRAARATCCTVRPSAGASGASTAAAVAALHPNTTITAMAVITVFLVSITLLCVMPQPSGDRVGNRGPLNERVPCRCWGGQHGPPHHRYAT